MKTALYRKYRPSTFGEVIGQDVIVTTLTNQIEKGAVSHAYLFTGSRGTGKTSCAKIFARAVNCLSPVDGSPCGKCAVCKSLESPSNLDVVEMDAASNNGVDKIRDLRESVGYLPSCGKYKVYIIDEVHMLSGSAFNALLKTLEEPPAHVVFVLCTTEAHKLPATILSRCMRFDFRLVSTEKLFQLIKNIFAKEGAKADDRSLMHIARLGEGSVRDTLSIGDRCLSASDNLTYELALEITGTGSGEDAAALLGDVLNGDVGGVIGKVESFAGAGKSVTQISRELTVFARDLMVYQTSGENALAATKETLARMQDLAPRVSLAFLVKLIRTLGGADAEIRYSSSPRIVLESALLSLCITDSAPLTTGDLSTVGDLSGDRTPAATPYSAKPETKQTETPTATTETPEAYYVSRKTDDRTLHVLGVIRQKLRRSGNMRLFGEYSALPDNRVRLVGDKLYVFVDGGSYLTFAEPENINSVQAILDDLGGQRLCIEKLSDMGETALDKLIASIEGLDVTVTDSRGNKLR